MSTSFNDISSNLTTTDSFWWRDTRLSELVSLPSQLHGSRVFPHSTSSSSPLASTPQLFSYPTTFLPVPYHLDLSFPALLSTVIPLSQSVRQWSIRLPSPSGQAREPDVDMEIDQISREPPETSVAEIHPDGLLLYVSQASYESGTSPLSSWVPLISYVEDCESPLRLFER